MEFIIKIIESLFLFASKDAIHAILTVILTPLIIYLVKLGIQKTYEFFGNLIKP